MGDLADFVSDVIGSSAVRVEENLGDGFVRLVVDEAERRQARHDIRCVEDVVIEMLRNARNAPAPNGAWSCSTTAAASPLPSRSRSSRHA